MAHLEEKDGRRLELRPAITFTFMAVYITWAIANTLFSKVIIGGRFVQHLHSTETISMYHLFHSIKFSRLGSWYSLISVEWSDYEHERP